MTNDPFAEPNDTERTVMRPRPGGRAPVASASPRAPIANAPVPSSGANPLLAAAAPLLEAAIRIANVRGGRPPDVDQLRRGMVDAVRAFEKAALATGLDTKSLRAARYALCATIDDVVLSTPWGASGGWSQQTLTSIFHNEVTGGERFFEILEQMSRELGRHAEVVELMYVCTSIGFEGRYRVMPRGVAALTELRAGTYRAIRTRRGEVEHELSPQWRGLAVPAGLSRRVPLWAVGLTAVSLACLMYAGFNLALAGRSDIAYLELSGLPPATAPRVPRAAPAEAPEPAPAAIVQTGAAADLHKFLAPEIAQGLVTVLEDAQTVTVRIANRSMFASGSADLNAGHAPLLQRIGDALQAEPGRVVIRGYTDNQPIRTLRFPSNFQLSQARAQAVAAVVASRLKDSSRVRAEGRGEADPLASNDTSEGRQANRRTEILLVRAGE